MCFNGECPLHDHCLRWQAGHYLPERLYSAVEPPQQRRVVAKNQAVDILIPDDYANIGVAIRNV